MIKIEDIKSIISKNQKIWDDNVESKKLCTIPWLNLNMELLNDFAEGNISGFDKQNGRINIPIIKKIRKLLYKNLKGKKVLCLASGGGQQSVVFSLLGADVTVADISQKQLNGDIMAAKHYGYKINTVLCSMTDLSFFSPESFDIVFQPVSICFVPDVFPVYLEVYKVLKPNGIYSVGHINPATYPTSFVNGIDGWDRIGYRIASPYVGGALLIDENGNENMTKGEIDGEFRHLFIDIFCKLTEAGFNIKYVTEDERNLIKYDYPIDKEYEQGFSIVQRYFEVLSLK